MNKSDSPSQIRLSPQGENRRVQILDELQSDLGRIHRRRKQLRAAGPLLVLIGLAVGFGWWLAKPQPSDRDNGSNIAEHQSPESFSFESTRIAVVENRKDLVDKYVVRRDRPQGTVSFQSIDDDQLLQLLSEQGRPSVLARIGGEAKVVSRKKL